MAGNCCASSTCSSTQAIPPSYRRALWIALAVNLAMFGVELSAGWGADSASLMADAVDFFGDAANYAVSLLKGLTMGGYGLYVLSQAAWNGWIGAVPHAETMGVIGVIALVANLGVAVLLYTYRSGDANMRSVWLCSRNDAIGNVAVLLAAVGVFGTGTAWPDLIVAVGMAMLGLSAAWQVIGQARRELATVEPRVQFG